MVVGQIFAAHPEGHVLVDPIGCAGAQDKIIGRFDLLESDRIVVLSSHHPGTAHAQCQRLQRRPDGGEIQAVAGTTHEPDVGGVVVGGEVGVIEVERQLVDGRGLEVDFRALGRGASDVLRDEIGVILNVIGDAIVKIGCARGDFPVRQRLLDARWGRG